jgi:UDP:flavonoid glycosyltransferase YjiC (YdhE family)
MRTNLKIDFVAPPLAGHLFPQLQLARYAQSQGFNRLRFCTCPKMRTAVEKHGIGFLPVLANKETELLSITDRPEQVMRSIKGMLACVALTLDLMKQFSNELRDHWRADRPDLIVVDFLSPFAGIVADELGIPWWTAIPSPGFIEVQKGTPTYLGGWQPPKTVLGKCRDALGRSFIRMFKKTVFYLYRNRLQSLGYKSLYRDDGSERMFSADVILGLGIPELEFGNVVSDSVFPKAMHWIGPCTESPVLDFPAPLYEPEKKHILISLGTQIIWAKERAERVIREVARLLPEYVFHYTLGNTSLREPLIENNLHFYGYIPYTSETLRNYDVIVDHGGTGVLYAAILAGVPQLVWAQDHDQHDNAARIAHHGLGLRSRGKAQSIVMEIKKLLNDDSYRKRTEEYRQIVERYKPGQTFVELVRKKFA